MTISEHVPESNVDVLIIGAGPAGLMAACWMAHCGVTTRIIDKRGTKIFSGQADGLQCRSLEIFDSFGFADRAWKEANHMIEICLWNPGPDGIIRRSDRIPDTIVGLSRFQQITLHQGRIERFFLDNIKKYSNDTIKVERGVLPESLEIDETEVEDQSSYPVTVKLRHLTDEEATPQQQISGSKISDGLFRSNLTHTDDEDDLIRKNKSRAGTGEIVHAKYVIGCDGARSWTRRALGFELLGEATDSIWGVLDIIPITDFPDIRMRCTIHSTENGTLMVIPREDKLVRLYIQLKEVTPDASGRADRSKISPDSIFNAAKKILSPYKIDYEYCAWWTAYQIGQRVATRFDSHERVFLAGDAVHTHSPKAGQGMNISMNDTYNLGWKIALVAKGIAKPSILSTYQSERRKIAQDLIDFDHRFSRFFSGRPAKDIMDAEGISMGEFKEAFEKGNLFASGLSVNYEPSNLVSKAVGESKEVLSDATSSANAFTKQSLAKGLPIGMRFNSFKVVNQSDARPWHFQEKLRSTGQFRIVVFAGNILSPPQKKRLEDFCEALGAPDSFFRTSATSSPPLDAPIEVLTIHSAERVETNLMDFPEILHPYNPHTGWDYDKIFVDDVSYHEDTGKAYENYGVDKERGCVVVARPDQYVGWVGDLEDFKDLQRYFEGCLMLSLRA
ncbi:putative phenol 2-monooxygenase [Daldinia caldariorum]|uniref:putative phenol 2-monooxygenase n=1 Tax=Daldinia caldariorum TaxID=326644 RepID=UPI0020088058|nr:putative phenol 2-monooxygenase [Daldinia caldariorum]KAI1465824.1 putative phenol 2-monooxygenase [Daldinia caldariorum]